MLDDLDERLALPVEQGVLLWSMRVWVIGLRHEIEASRRIEDMMRRLGADHAAPYLEGFMFALGHGPTRRIAIHCTCHGLVGADERILLDALRLAQESRLSEALLLLRGMATEAAARAALRSARGLGTELALAGRFLEGAGLGEAGRGEAGLEEAGRGWGMGGRVTFH